MTSLESSWSDLRRELEAVLAESRSAIVAKAATAPSTSRRLVVGASSSDEVSALDERVRVLEKKTRPIIETVGGGGFFSAKPGRDKVAVGDANGNWELVDKSTLGGGIYSTPPAGAFKVTNLYVVAGQLVVEWDDGT